MRYEEKEGLRILYADTDKYITNGEVYTTMAYLGNGDSPDRWRDADTIPEEEQDITDSEALRIITGQDE